MKEQEYKQLQVWCQSNKKNPDYQAKVDLRNRATAIRRNVIFYKSRIKQFMFYLEASKSEEAINKWKDAIEKAKQARDENQKLFENLQL